MTEVQFRASLPYAVGAERSLRICIHHRFTKITASGNDTESAAFLALKASLDSVEEVSCQQ